MLAGHTRLINDDCAWIYRSTMLSQPFSDIFHHISLLFFVSYISKRLYYATRKFYEYLVAIYSLKLSI